MPQFVLDLDGHCTHASQALATLLQCGVSELLDDGWRVRLSPYAASPFSAMRLIEHARKRQTLRLNNPTSNTTLVTRLRTITAPDSLEVTGFFGWVQAVRVHRRTGAAMAALSTLMASA